MTPGQPSSALLAKLKTLGAAVTTARLVEAVTQVERSRATFVRDAVDTGLLLLAKKQTLKHGDFEPLAAEMWTALTKANGQHAAHLGKDALHNFARSLRVYMHCAQHFLADLEQNGWQAESRDLAIAPPAVTPDEVLALDTLGKDKRLAVLTEIESFVAGRSLRRMLMDFRRAEDAADQEEIDEAARKRKKKKGGDTGQLDFWEEIKRPLTEIETLCASPETLKHATKDFWLNLATALDAQAKRARERAKEVQS